MRAKRQSDFYDEEMLFECFRRLSENKAAGIDEVTKNEYAENLEANIRELVGRLHRMAYRPQAVRRVYIPKPGSGKLRPLGIPCLEDKLVQSVLARMLGAIYEQDFVEGSYGFRPGRSCHDALRALSQAVEDEGTNYIGYLGELVRYIHLNSVRAKIVRSPDVFQYSGHRVPTKTGAGRTIQITPPPKFLALSPAYLASYIMRAVISG